MKKIFIILSLLIVIALIIFILMSKGKEKPTFSKTYLMDYGDYKKINANNIKQIEIIRYTEGGDNHQIVSEEDIPKIYNNLKQKKLGKKTNMACEDNTTVYIFTLNDDTTLSIEIECDWVIINNERYILE